MLLRESGFTYFGKHSLRDMGLDFAEKDFGHVNTPRPNWNTYQIAGVSGTAMFPGETWGTMRFDGVLYPAAEPATQAAAQALLRRVNAWLTAGRGPLIFDWETDKYYLAEIAQETRWSLKNWFGGELSVSWTAQPFAYAVQETTLTRAYTTQRYFTFQLDLSTGKPSPVSVTVENTGDAPITAVDVAYGQILLNGMALAGGETLEINMEPPVGAMIGTASAMAYARAFMPVMAQDGRTAVRVLLTYGTGETKTANVTVKARGRW